MAEAKPTPLHQTIEEHSKLFRDLVLGFIKVHILHHASRDAIYGAGIILELERHGYRLSPGTLYPLLHTLEAAELLWREDRVVAAKVRKYHHLTLFGQEVLNEARRKAVGLVDEVTEPDTKASARRRQAIAGPPGAS
ncbi:MAG: PadR family transcriptional regulator [Acidimicrobiales bacterium]